MRVEAARYARIVEVRLPIPTLGAYLHQDRLILLDKHLTDIQRRCILAHELSHAKHADAGCLDVRAMEQRANREAASWLVSPIEYAALEVVSDNIAWLAHELNVMPWVIEAYRAYLHDHPDLIVQ